MGQPAKTYTKKEVLDLCKQAFKEGRDSIIDENQELDAMANERISPSYYDKGGIQTWEFIGRKQLDFFEGAIVKYIVRWKEKDGIQDLLKAQSYINKLIEMQKA
jgi:hypothetical protein